MVMNTFLSKMRHFYLSTPYNHDGIKHCTTTAHPNKQQLSTISGSRSHRRREGPSRGDRSPPGWTRCSSSGPRRPAERPGLAATLQLAGCTFQHTTSQTQQQHWRDTNGGHTGILWCNNHPVLEGITPHQLQYNSMLPSGKRRKHDTTEHGAWLGLIVVMNQREWMNEWMNVPTKRSKRSQQNMGGMVEWLHWSNPTATFDVDWHQRSSDV